MEVTDPTIVFLLIALGLAGIGIEILTPGGILPALVGVIAMILGVIGLIDIGSVTAGIGFIFLAVGFFIAATAFRDYRVLSVLGVVSLVAAGIFMFNRSSEPTSIPIVVVGAMVVGGFMMFVIERANLAKSEPIRSGPEHLIGTRAEVRESLAPGGQVFADGALWQARLASGEGRIGIGEEVTIVAIEGLTLLVRNNEEEVVVEIDESEATAPGQEAGDSGPDGPSGSKEG